MKWITELFTPTLTPRETPAHHEPSAKSTLMSVIIAEIVSGPSSTLADKATFVAMPHVIKAVADFSAYKENGESK